LLWVDGTAPRAASAKTRGGNPDNCINPNRRRVNGAGLEGEGHVEVVALRLIDS
jgi:hypothetical protein